MSIIIENKEDIELLIEFFKLFNTSENGVQNDDDLRDRVNQIDKWRVEQSDTKKNLAKTLLKVDLRVKKIEDCLKNNVAFGVDAEETVSTKRTTYRKYSQKTIDNLPQIKSLRNDGYFILGRKKQSVYSIEDVLRLKSLIPQLEVNFEKMGELIGVSDYTARIICCAIEHGIFDRWFKEWEQIQANKFYGNWKPNSIVNNPQKRKENGMV